MRTSMRPNRRQTALLAGALLLAGACEEPRSQAEVSAAAATDSAAVTAVVHRFGGRLAHVSLLAPRDQLSGRIRSEYGPSVTLLLLSAWLSDPSTAPGREASSPWPDRIEVREARRVRVGQYRVEGDVVYVTSVAADSSDVALRQPVTIGVVQGDDGQWRITEWAD